MRNTSWHHATLVSLLIAGLAIGMGGCTSDSSLIDPTTGRVTIQAIPSTINAPWVLSVPGGTVERRSGDVELQAMPYGSYTITWGAVEGWNPPTPSIMRGTHDSGQFLIFTAFYTKSDVTKGTIIVDPNPDDLEISWTLTGPHNFELAGAGDQTVTDLPAGTYVLTWGEVGGYTTPDQDSALLAESQTVDFSQTYFLREMPRGDLVVEVEPSGLDAPWRIVGSLDIEFTGSGDSTFTDIPIGQYIVIWSPVEGFNSPSPNPNTTSVPTDGSATFHGTYTEITVPTGTISIDPNPNSIAAPWTLSGPSRFATQGTGDAQMLGREVGEYTVTWGAVEGFDAPSPQTRVLQADQSLAFSGTYVQQTGSLTLNPEPNSINAPWTLSGPQGSSGSGDRTYDSLPVGTYTLEWGSVNGWIRPSPTSRIVALGSNQQVTITGAYEVIPALEGTIIIDPLPAELNAPWSLRDPDGSSWTGSGALTLSGLAVGEYTVNWLAVSGWNQPAPAETRRTLAAGATERFTGVYQNPTGPSIASSFGSSAHGSTIRLVGSSFGSHTLDLEWTGDWIEDQPEGTNPASKTGWSHVYSGNGMRDHITASRSWSGEKSIDTSIDQTKTPYSDASTLSYLHSDFDRIYATWWTYIQPLAHSPIVSLDFTQLKHIYVTTESSFDGKVLQAATNSTMNGLRIGKTSSQPVTFWWENNTWIGCPGIALPFTDVWNNAYGLGYTMQSQSYWRPAINYGASDFDNVRTFAPSMGSWSRQELYLYRGSGPDVPDGEVQWAVMKPGQGRFVGSDAGGVVHQTDRIDCRSEPDPWQRFVFMLFYDDPSHGDRSEQCDIFIDDVYLQFGTRARIELGDAPDYESCTNLEVQVPTAWSAGEVSVRVNHGGAFSAGRAAYFFVVREDGQVSSGFPVVLQ